VINKLACETSTAAAELFFTDTVIEELQGTFTSMFEDTLKYAFATVGVTTISLPEIVSPAFVMSRIIAPVAVEFATLALKPTS
jgi:hypothetical protein